MATVYAVGIDFGTANSCVAFASYIDRGNGEVDPDALHRPEVIPFYNRDTIPTAMHLGDGKSYPVTFGSAAEERAVFDPLRFYTGFKLNLGHPDPQRARDARLMTRYFMAYLRRRIAQFVPLESSGQSERVETIVGHPVQWNSDQREATLQAAREAGFPNVRLEEESLAALYCHVFDERTGFVPRPGSYVLTIDMGGGTTDFAFLQIPEDPRQRPVSIPVHPATEKGRSYGGRDLDSLLLAYLGRQWQPEIVQGQQRFLLREIRKFKETFSNNLAEGAFEYESVVVVGDRPQRVRLTQREFEQLAANYIHYYDVLVRGALAEAQLRPEQVGQLILTGGHSRWYFVEKTLGRVFPHLFVGHHTIFRHSHPEQSVARGLAYNPLVRSSRGGFLAPMRRAAHPIWLHVPSSDPTDSGGVVEPLLLLPRGQLLPYLSQTPVKFQVAQTGTGGPETRVKVQLLTGPHRTPLADRVATFQRGVWEQVAGSLAMLLRRGGGARTDRFEVEVHLNVDEHELINAELAVTRFRGNRAVEVQRQKLQINVPAALGRDSFGGVER